MARQNTISQERWRVQWFRPDGSVYQERTIQGEDDNEAAARAAFAQVELRTAQERVELQHRAAGASRFRIVERRGPGPRFVLVQPGADASNTSGHIGIVGLENVYLTTYADYGDHPHPRTLELGARTQATFRLSGERGTYDVVRVS